MRTAPLDHSSVRPALRQPSAFHIWTEILALATAIALGAILILSVVVTMLADPLWR
jgi:hypothetical protein